LAEYSSLIWIAEDKGYFGDSSLDVTIKRHESRFAAIKDLMSDKKERVPQLPGENCYD
jgi:hypothetical protein